MGKGKNVIEAYVIDHKWVQNVWCAIRVKSQKLHKILNERLN